MKKKLIVLSLISLLIFSMFFFRHFRTVGNITFTIWKSQKGCIITPYIFLGLSEPKSDYILASNIGSALIFIKNDTSFIVFDDRMEDSIICYSKNINFEIKSRNNYSLEDINKWSSTIDSCNSKKLPFINIEARWLTIYNSNNR